jgi:putative Holliday junction resolvase
MADNKSALALDVGGARIGLAVTSLAARLPRPLTTLQFDADFFDNLRAIIDEEDVAMLVVGLPRNLAGEETQQSLVIKDFVDQLKGQIDLPIHYQDEALTSRKAEEELQSRGQSYEKSDIDALAATYILEDWLTENQ